MNKIKTLFLLLAVMLITGCAGLTETNDNKDLTIGLMPDVDSIPFILAQEKGYFKAEGVNVTLMPFKSAQERDSALQSGNLDGAVSDILALVFFNDGGFNVKATSATDGSYKLIAKKDGATNVAELSGGNVAVSKNTIIEYVTDKVLERENLPETSINKVIIPQIPIRLEMLQQGKLDGATMPEPIATVALSEGGVKLASSDGLNINPGVFVVTEQTLTNKKNALQAMYRAYNKAANDLNTVPKEEYIDVVSEKLGFPPAARDTLTLPHYRRASLPTVEDTVGIANWLNYKALVKRIYHYNEIVTDILP